MNNKPNTPDVIVKSGDAPLDSGKRILTVREREALEESLKIHTGILSATSDSYGMATQGGTPVLPPGMAINKARINQKAKDIMKVLEEGRPEPYSASEKDRAVKRLEEIRGIFEKDNVLETRKELHVMRRDDPAWFTALAKGAKRPQYEPLINEYRNIARRLEPEDDMADSLDKLRKDK